MTNVFYHYRFLLLSTMKTKQNNTHFRLPSLTKSKLCNIPVRSTKVSKFIQNIGPIDHL